MLQEQIDSQGAVQAKANILYGEWPETALTPQWEYPLADDASSQNNRPVRSWPDVRKCSCCGGKTVSSRYRRHAIRFLSAYRCTECRHHFEQETRGFQGFYVGCLLSFAVPSFALAFQGTFTFAQLLVLGAVLGLLAVPVYKNVKLLKTEPVLARSRGSRLMSRRTGRSLFGRILAGDSHLYGFLLAILSVLLSLVIVFSAALAASAMAV